MAHLPVLRRKTQISNRHRNHRLVSLVLLFAMLCSLVTPLTATASPEPQFIPPFPEGGEGGLTVVLSDGSALPDEVDGPPVATGRPLGVAETQAVLDRLPALEGQEGDQQEFRLPPQSPPPPKTGATINESFPPTTTVEIPEVDPTAPLEVLRYAPEGEIPIAPFLNVTFNQPMAPLGTVDQLAAEDVPVILTPALPGTWTWLGTSTLSFEYASDEIDRFPMAGEFTVTVPAGTTSALGNELAEDVTWTFTTPPPTVINQFPTYGPQPANTVIYLEFDQRINRADMLPFISVSGGGEPIDVRLAADEEIAANDQVRLLVENAPEERWIALRSVESLPLDSTINVAVTRGAPSAEGPITTDTVQSFSFQTYAPLRIVEHLCSFYDDRCPPFSPFLIRFNNPLDQEKFDRAHFSVEPEIPGLFVNLYGDMVEMTGATAGRTEYTVTVSGEVTDIFGQPLGEDEELTFSTTDAPRMLTGPDIFATLDPALETPALSVYSVNVDELSVHAFAVTPDDWQAYQEFQNRYRYDAQMPDPPGRPVWSETVTVGGTPDELTETIIDLSAALGGPTGHLIVVVEDTAPPRLQDRGPENGRVVVWTQATQIGLDAFSDASTLVAWATDLNDGAPLEDVDVALYGVDIDGVTDGDGIAVLPLDTQGSALLVATLDEDTAILPASSYYWNEDAWAARPLRDELRWYVFDDRQMYRPGETVHIKGWLREMGGGPTGDISLPETDGLSVRYQLVDPFGNELVNEMVEVNDLAGFDFALALPENANLGWATVYLTAQGTGRDGGELDGQMYAHSFQVQEFRRPEFEVTTQVETAGPHFLDGEATAVATAAYFAGGPLPNAPVNWTVSTMPGSYAPPNWPDFIFGKWRPWWGYYGEPFGGPGSGVQVFEGSTDATGSHYLNMDFVEMAEPRPYNVTASAAVMDVNRQVWNSSTSLLVHPADLYVGLRSDSTFVEQGDPLEIQAIVPDVDGAAVAGVEILMEAARLEWEIQNGVWTEVEVDPQTCTVTSAEEPVLCTFTTDVGGEYRIRATVTDDAGRANRSEFTRWVSGGERPPARNVEQEEAVLIPDQESYAPGDEAEILVQTPFFPATGLLTISRNGILETTSFQMDEGSTVLRIPIEDGHIPTLNVKVDLTGSAPRTNDEGEVDATLPPRPAYAMGELQLSIPPVSRTLTVEIEPESTALEPGATTAVDLRIVDADGNPVADSEVALVVVDEAILALTGYQLTDPLDVFYRTIYGNVDSTYARRSIVLSNPLELATRMAGMGGGGDMADEAMMFSAANAPAMAGTPAPEAAMDMAVPQAEPAMVEREESADDSTADGDAGGEAIQVRSNFDPLALFAPAQRTDADGRARVEFTLPDNLTRYRIMAVAVDDSNLFGSAEANLTARLPLMVRPSAPRFLNFGDRFELPVVIQNQTEQEMTVDVAVDATNLRLTESAGQQVTVPANDRVEVRFPAETAEAGTARLRIAAVAGSHADAADGELPVYTPATTEAFATYGVVDDDGSAVIQPLLTPENVFPQFGGLEVNTSSTALQALTDAVIYLNDYPFAAAEPLASRILGIAALRDVLTAFDAEGLPAPAELEAAVQADIAELQALQNNDGGFPTWRRGYPSEPYTSVHVAHALQKAKEKGFEVPAEMQTRVLDYLRQIDRHIPSWYSAKSRHALESYAVYVRDLMGDADTAEAQRLYTRMPLSEQSLEATAWIWQVLSGDPVYTAEVEEIRRHVNNNAVETAGAANFFTSYGDDEYLLLHSDRRTDAIVLDALINDEPESDLIPKVVNGLLAHQTAGRWDNTQENVFVLLALDRYFNTYEDVTPDFVARVWLGETTVAEHEFRGRTTDQRQTLVPMDALVDTDEATQDLTLVKDGDGRLYYRLGLRYAPTDLDLDPLDRGFVVQRSYEAVDDPADVQRDEDGTWRIKSGARVKVALTMVAPTRRYHVALVDPLPAGLEIINPALAVSEPLPEQPEQPEPYEWWWYGPWYEHQNLRDSRAEAFQTLLWDGVYDYTYYARATTPGEFIVPPAKAEEMYSPEVFGRSGSDRVVVE